MDDDFWSFVGVVLFAATFGFGGYFIADDPALRYVGLGLGCTAAAAVLIAAYLAIMEELDSRRERRKFYQGRLEERLNSLEVWREEEDRTQRLNDLHERVDDLDISVAPVRNWLRIQQEIRRIFMTYEYEPISLWPLTIAFVIAAIYFYFKKGGKHGDR